LPDILLCRHQNEGVIDPPLTVTDAFVVGDLERVGAQIEQLGEAQRDEGILPDIQTGRALFGKRRFWNLERFGADFHAWFRVCIYFCVRC
jgi:hypothetical protein